jgi:hypothetical protein
MRSTMIRHATTIASAATLLGLFTCASMDEGPLSATRATLVAAAVVFAYIVFRLSGEMFAASVERRRKAQRRLLVAAAVPVLVLTPSAVGAMPRDAMPLILISSAVWMAVVMSYASFILRRAARLAATHRQGTHTRSSASFPSVPRRSAKLAHPV